MSSSVKLKEAFEAKTKHGAFFTGGNVEWHEDILYCQSAVNVNLLSFESGTVIKTIGEGEEDPEDADADSIQTFTSDGVRVITSHKSGLLKLWNQNGELEKMWKYIHKGPIARLALQDEKLASGGSDGIIRIWNLQYQACTLSLKGCQGVVNVVQFHPTENGIFGSGDDGKLNYYELEKGELKICYDAHYSKVTALVFAHDGLHFVSSGRDKVIVLWQFGKNVALKTIAVYETIESIVSLPSKFKLPDGFKADAASVYIASAGENGIIRIWDILKAKEVFVQNNSLISKSSEDGGLAITNLIFNKTLKALAVVSSDQNIIIHHLKSFACIKQFVGFTDEILDISFVGKTDDYLAVATNSKDIKLYHNNTMNCQLIKGHTDLVLSLSTSKANPNLFVSSAKDNSVRLWLLEDASVKCVGIGTRHTGSVGSVAFSQNDSKFIVSASQDTCIKLWEVPSKFEENCNLECKYTQIGHQRDINCVTVSPNDKIIASASQDKTAKLWSDSLSLVGVLKGHKRGVWSIRFSPVDQVVLTSSADCTVKLWSVNELTCLKTFEGHESSVLRAEFMSHGMQIVSAGADGLIKIFNLKSSDCACTLDEHYGRIWALAIKNDESGIVSGGSDSLLVKWRDVTEERKQQRQNEMEELALQEQKLRNYLQNNNYLKALKLSLKLNRPYQTLKIIQGVIKKGDSGLSDTIKELRNDQKEMLLKCALNWNMNSKNCQPAQLLLNILLNELQEGQFRPVGLSAALESALPYTERHFKRLTQLVRDLQFMNYTINCMQPHAKNLL